MSSKPRAASTYAGVIPFAAGVPSTRIVVGPAGALIRMLLIARRAVVEERLLGERLEGYAASMERVRWRLVPGVW